MPASKPTVTALLFMSLLGSQARLATAQPPEITPTQPSSRAASLDGPITRSQLQTYFDESLLLQASMQHIQDGIQQSRGQFPTWFPEPVWQDIKKQVAQIDLVGLLLPLYQRHFTRRDGEALVLSFQGPTGHAYAQAALDSRLDAVHSGLEGSAAEAAAMKSDKEAQAKLLLRKRVSELTPDELQALRSADAHRSTAEGLKLDDEQNALITAKGNEVLQATLKVHNAELVAAQRKYMQDHPASH